MCEKGGDDYIVLKTTRWWYTQRNGKVERKKKIANLLEVSVASFKKGGERQRNIENAENERANILRCFVTIKCF